MPQCQHSFVDRRLLESLDLLGTPVLLDHLLPVEFDNAREDIRVELGVLDVTKVLGQTLARQCLGFPFASFIPSAPPSSDVLTFVHPWLSHSLYHIGTSHPSVRWRGRGPKWVETKRRHDGARGACLYLQFSPRKALWI